MWVVEGALRTYARRRAVCVCVCVCVQQRATNVVAAVGGGIPGMFRDVPGCSAAT